MKKKKREFLLVPPDAAKVRTIKVPGRLIVFLGIIIACGFTGYFIPFNGFTIDVVEQNQKKNLENQNVKLLTIIRPMRRLLDNLGNEVQRLEQKRQVIAGHYGTKESTRPPARQKNRVSQAGFDDLAEKVRRDDLFFRWFAAIVANNSGCFDSIPIIKPIVSNPMPSALFDRQMDPFTGTEKNHFGMDFIGVAGTSIIATASGTVVKIEDGRIWGKRIFINHGFEFSTVYAHMGTLDAFLGKKVRKGDCIGTIGLSGLTSGPHLHYEIWHKGTPVNPEEMFFPELENLAPFALR
jgi:murein DD-endopeptidase MepM/ murein hydrolase activator NlpD